MSVPADPAARRAADLARVDRIASLLDTKFRIPGTGVRFGWDFILGLVPGLGDLVTLGPGAFLVYEAWRMGARRRTLTRMAVNTGLDFVLGGVPVLGDLFDLFFKANRRNAVLLRREVEARHPLEEAPPKAQAG